MNNRLKFYGEAYEKTELEIHPTKDMPEIRSATHTRVKQSSGYGRPHLDFPPFAGPSSKVAGL